MTIEIEITKEMVAAGADVIAYRWSELAFEPASELYGETAREVYLAMLEARSKQEPPPAAHDQLG